MGKGVTSPIWEHYDKLLAEPGFVLCKKCKSKISRGNKNPKKMTNTNMLNHLRVKHKSLFDLYRKTDEENNEKRKKEQDEEAGRSTLKNQRQKDEYFQQTLPEAILRTVVWHKDSSDAKEGHKRVLLMMIQDMQPYSDIMKGGLLQLLKFLQPKFKPGTDKFYRDMMQASYQKCKETIREMINEASPDQVSLVLDGWSAFHHGYVGVNIHYIDKNWKRVKINLGCKRFDESHTGEALAGFISDLTNNWNIYEKIYVVVTDSASNMKTMFNFLPWDRADCGNHTAQLVINDEVFNMASDDTLCCKCRTVCTFANKSYQFAQALIQAQVSEDHPGVQGLYLVQDVATRWNSTFNMLERFLKLREGISKVLDDQKWEKKLKVNIYRADWDLMSKVVTVLRGFKEATEMLFSSQASISQIIPVVTIINESLKRSGEDQGVKSLKAKLQASLQKRFSHKEFDAKYAIATLLDPRYKKNFFQSQEAKDSVVAQLLNELKEEARKGVGADVLLLPAAHPVEAVEEEEAYTIKSLMKKVIAANQERNEAQPGSAGREEEILFGFLSAPVEESLCLEFWKEFENGAAEDPVKLALARLAKKYLTPPPTSTDVERLFSVAGNILTDERNPLLPENLDKLLFLKENIFNLNFKL